MSDTPETDAIAGYEGNWDTKALRMGAFARKLERERDAFEKELAYVREVLLDAMPHIGGSTKKLAELLVKERDYWRAEVERWQEVAK